MELVANCEKLEQVGDEEEQYLVKCLLSEHAVSCGYSVKQFGNYLHFRKKPAFPEESPLNGQGEVNWNSTQVRYILLRLFGEYVRRSTKIDDKQNLMNNLITPLEVFNILSQKHPSEAAFLAKSVIDMAKVPQSNWDFHLLNMCDDLALPQYQLVICRSIDTSWQKVFTLRCVIDRVEYAQSILKDTQLIVLEKMTNLSASTAKTKLQSKYDLMQALKLLETKLASSEKDVGLRYRQTLFTDFANRLEDSNTQLQQKIQKVEKLLANPPSHKYMQTLANLKRVQSQINSLKAARQQSAQ